MGLENYKRKRNFFRTTEPSGKQGRGSENQLRFVVQKHHATRLHYDLRLEMEGVLRSWAVPKGPTLNPGDKRLAILVEDHPVEYGDFEGVIPEGEYGAGKVIVWDRGTYECLGAETDPVRAWKKGTLDLYLRGEKLRGMWLLIKLTGKEENQWLFFKKDDEYARLDLNIIQEAPESVISGLEVDELEEDVSPIWNSRVQRLLEELQVPFRDIRGKVRPMLATLVDQVPEGSHWIYELKYDGIRALAQKKRSAPTLLSKPQVPGASIPRNFRGVERTVQQVFLPGWRNHRSK